MSQPSQTFLFKVIDARTLKEISCFILHSFYCWLLLIVGRSGRMPSHRVSNKGALCHMTLIVIAM